MTNMHDVYRDGYGPALRAVRQDERERIRKAVQDLWGRSSKWDDAIEAVLEIIDRQEQR